MTKYYLLLLVLVLQINLYSQSTRKISVDFSAQSIPRSQVYKECIGAGRANEGLRADWQNQLKMVQDEIGFKYIRMHGLLHDDMGLYTEDHKGNPIYNWQYVDRLYDFLLSVDIKPFVELSFMPKALASGNKTVFWWNGNITPPKSYDKWYDFIKALTQHFTDRYGVDEVKTWYFEVWNEPNLSFFFTGDMNEYFKLYDYTVKAVRAVNKEYKVGGPATAGNGWIPEMIEHCATNNIPIDFIATHDYAVRQGFFDASGQTGTIIDPDVNAITKNIKASRAKIDASVKPTLELHYTEWSSSYTPTDAIHDTYQEASFILDKVKNSQPFCNSMSYWVFTDIFEENGPRMSPFHGGFGLINYQDIKKPAYYAYKFLSEMGDTELKSNDAASIIAKDEEGNVQVLFWDFTIDHPGDSTNNQVFYKRDLPSKPVQPVSLLMSNLPEGTYLLTEYATGYLKNDAYTQYVHIGSPSQLSLEQEKALKELSNGAPEKQQIIKIEKNKPMEISYPMRANDVKFITLKKL
jgi:xylan 1,4-beta-xylosidase